MDRLVTNTLARFCVAQSNHFDAHDWLLLDGMDIKAIALVARYLSMTSWYGHEDELEGIAAHIHAFDGDSAGLYRESQQLEFDLPYFSSAVRFGILRSQCHNATA